MKKRVYFFFFCLSLIVFSINFYFQKNPGYMDAEYYFLGGRYLAQGSLNAPFLWNYLDDPSGLPHPLFTYWKPFASILAALPMKLLGSLGFQSGRSIFYLLASILSPLTIFITFQITNNKFKSYLAGILAIFCGYYFKLLTIPETITPYLLFGGLYFLTAFNLIQSFTKRNLKRKIFILGFISGLMAFSRVDGILFIGFSLILILFLIIKTLGFNIRSLPHIFLCSLICVFGFILWLIPEFILNYHHTGTIFSQIGVKALWINSYDDTFIFPANQLSINYWFLDSWINKITNIRNAFLLNIGTLSAVQLNIFSIPLFGLGVWQYRKEIWLKFFVLVAISLFLFMTILFPLAGSRGGYLHSGASLQIINWLLISVGFYEFLLWGIKSRNWELARSKLMFGSAIILFSIIFTAGVYYRDVIGDNSEGLAWNADYNRYTLIENVIADHSKNKNEVVLINNPVGYHYQTERWAIVLPNSDQEHFEEIIKLFDVRFLVVDNNIPVRMKDYVDSTNNSVLIGIINEYETMIYEIKNE